MALAHPSHEEQARELVTNQLHHGLGPCKTLPLNNIEKVTVINRVLIVPWTCRGLFRGNRHQMVQWDDPLLQYLRDTPGIESRVNRHWITMDVREGGLSLRQIWWSFITRWITLGQNGV